MGEHDLTPEAARGMPWREWEALYVHAPWADPDYVIWFVPVGLAEEVRRQLGAHGRAYRAVDQIRRAFLLACVAQEKWALLERAKLRTQLLVVRSLDELERRPVAMAGGPAGEG